MRHLTAPDCMSRYVYFARSIGGVFVFDTIMQSKQSKTVAASHYVYNLGVY